MNEYSVSTEDPAIMTTPTLQRTARLTGIFWLLTILAGFATLAVKGPSAQAANTFAALTYLGATLYAVRLFKPVNETQAIVTGVLGTVGSLISLEQMHIHSLGWSRNTPFLFFGFQLILLGYLIRKSDYIPTWVGFLLAFGGLGWLTLGLSSLLAPEFARTLVPFILLPGVVGETALTIRLLTKGVKI